MWGFHTYIPGHDKAKTKINKNLCEREILFNQIYKEKLLQYIQQIIQKSYVLSVCCLNYLNLSALTIT